MDRDEILKISRNEKRDERDEQIQDKSMRWTLITMVALSAVFAYIRAGKGESVMDLSVVVCGSVFVSFLYRYIKTKKTENLVLGIICLLVAILALIRFCLGY